MCDLFRHEAHAGPGATVEIDLEARANSPVSPRLYGKFSEHLAWNVYHGMEAQLLYNPTFGRWRFRAAAPTEDGGYVGSMDPHRRQAMIKEHAELKDYPTADGLESAVQNGLAFWWQQYGASDAVEVSPDVGPHRDRAQRIEVRQATSTEPAGIVQWTYLPLQRTRTFEYSVTTRARADTSAELRLALHQVEGDGTVEAELAAASLEIRDE